MPTDPPATLAAWLRTRSDEQLSALLAARPDVARPAPSDVVALASRLAVPVSVDRALDELDAATLQVLDVVLLAPTDGVAPERRCSRRCPTCPDDVLAGRPATGSPPGRCCGATTCCAPPTRCAAPSGTRRGWAAGPPSCACSCPPTWPPTLAELERRRARGAGAAGRRAPGRPPARLPPTAARTPARRLLQRGLLARIDALNVELPREIGLHLRGDRPYGPPRLRPEPAVDRPRAGVGRPAGGRRGAGERRPDRRAAHPARGGAGRAAAQRRGRRPGPEAAGPRAARRRARRRLAAGAGLRRRAARRRRAAPRRVAAHPRLRHLARAGPRRPLGRPGRRAGWPASGCRRWSGQRDVAGKAVNPLSPDLVRHTAPAIRRSALTVLAEYPPGSGLAPDDLVALLRWRTPRRADRLAPVPGDARRGRPARASLVGGVLSTAGRGLLDPRRGRRGRRHARPAARAGRPRARPARPLADRARAAGGRARRHPRRRRRRRVLRRGDGLPGVGVQRPAGAGRRLVGVGPARLLRPRLAHAGAPGAGLPGRRRRPPARPAAGRARSSPTSAPTTTGCSPRCSTTGGRRRPSCAGWRPACWSAAWAPTRCSTRAPRRRATPRPGENPGGAVLTRPPARPRAAGRRPGSRALARAAAADPGRARRHGAADARRGRRAVGPPRRGGAPGARA